MLHLAAHMSVLQNQRKIDRYKRERYTCLSQSDPNSLYQTLADSTTVNKKTTVMTIILLVKKGELKLINSYSSLFRIPSRKWKSKKKLCLLYLQQNTMKQSFFPWAKTIQSTTFRPSDKVISVLLCFIELNLKAC